MAYFALSIRLILSHSPDNPICFNEAVFTRGDVNNDGRISLTDTIYLLNYLFNGGPAPICKNNADADGDGVLTISDAIRILRFLFQGGNSPVIISTSDYAFLPYLYPLGPEENSEVTASFSGPDDAYILEFYPVNNAGSHCIVNAIDPYGSETFLFDTDLREIDELFPIKYSLSFKGPLGEGSYIIRSRCTNQHGTGTAEGRLTITTLPADDPN